MERPAFLFFIYALVRANYRNAVKGIEPDFKYLIRFFRNLLLGENDELKNRYMVVNTPEKCKEPEDTNNTPQVTP